MFELMGLYINPGKIRNVYIQKLQPHRVISPTVMMSI